MNVVWGENGSGKSNLLESIFFAATGRPSRAGRDGELIRFGEKVGRVEARGVKRISDFILEAALERIENFSARKVLRLNRQPVRKLSELLGEVKAVLFTPHDEALVRGEPSCRRRFLDLALSQVSSGYLHYLQQYQAVKDQRNSLLKRPHSPSELAPWSAQLVAAGSQLVMKRLEILPRLSALACGAHARLSRGEALTLSYLTTIPLGAEPSSGRGPTEIKLPPAAAPAEKMALDAVAAAFEKALQRAAHEESQRGMTLVGPHRDDLGIFLDGADARLFGSQGQQKIAALALKLAEGELYEEADGEPPVYLLDDCLSELDAGHQEAVLNIFLKGKQSILTMATAPSPSLEGVPVARLAVEALL